MKKFLPISNCLFRFVCLSLVFVLLINPAVHADRAVSDLERQEIELQISIESLRAQLEYLEDNEAPPNHRKLAVYILTGYAVTTTLGWWFGLSEGVGPWFFHAMAGVVGGLGAFAIKEEAGRSLFRKVKILRRIEKTLGELSDKESAQKTFELVIDASHVFHDLLFSHRLETSFERWIYLNWVDAFIRFHLKFVGSENSDFIPALTDVLESVVEIEKWAIRQKDLPIAHKSQRLRDRLMGLIGGSLKSSNWNDYTEWVETNRFRIEHVESQIQKISGASTFHSFLWEGDVSIHHADKETPYLVRMHQISARKISLFLSSDFESRSSAEVSKINHPAEVIGSFKRGVWIRFKDLDQKYWHFFGDEDALPYSEAQNLGRAEATLHPFKEELALAVFDLDRGLRVSEIRRRLERDRLEQSWWKSRLINLPGSCLRLLKSF